MPPRHHTILMKKKWVVIQLQTWEDVSPLFFADYHFPNLLINPQKNKQKLATFCPLFSIFPSQWPQKLSHRTKNRVACRGSLFSSHGLNLLLHTYTLLLIHPCRRQGSSPISCCITTMCDPSHTAPTSYALSEPTLEANCLLWVNHIRIHTLQQIGSVDCVMGILCGLVLFIAAEFCEDLWVGWSC